MSISTHLLKNITGADDATEIQPGSCLVKGNEGRNTVYHQFRVRSGYVWLRLASSSQTI